MQPRPDFHFPTRDAQPLQTLSPGRLNGSRQISTATTASAQSAKSFEEEIEERNVSVQSSPTRSAKINLFEDYHPVSPSRQRSNLISGATLPASPSWPEMTALRPHVRTNSDVQGLVKRFEHLDVRDRDAESAERRRRQEAELKRAQVAREEAESDVKRLREELRALRKERDEGMDRERLVSRRLEAVLEDFAAAKEAHSSQCSIYEKDVRKSRKEAFKSSSAVLKLQEDTKEMRKELAVARQNLELERRRAQSKEQEQFELEYRLIPMQEELEALQRKLVVVEEEKEALKTTLKEEEVARIAAEGMIALPTSQGQDDDLLTSPRKQSPRKRVPSPLSDDKENLHVVTKKEMDSRRLLAELEQERVRRQQAEAMSGFLELECMFRCCSRHEIVDSADDPALRSDPMIATRFREIKAEMHAVLGSGVDEEVKDTIMLDQNAGAQAQSAPMGCAFSERHEPVLEDVFVEAQEINATDLVSSMTMTTDSLHETTSAAESAQEEEVQSEPLKTDTQRETTLPEAVESSESTTTVPLQPSTPQAAHHLDSTPFRQHPIVRTVTTTTTVPMQFTPIAKPLLSANDCAIVEDAENIPPTISSEALGTPVLDRAAALAAIEYRRGRAKSIANGHATPRKQMLEGVVGRRDISAPALGQKMNVTPSANKLTSSTGRTGGKKVGV